MATVLTIATLLIIAVNSQTRAEVIAGDDAEAFGYVLADVSFDVAAFLKWNDVTLVTDHRLCKYE
jgi:hypothetical protein